MNTSVENFSLNIRADQKPASASFNNGNVELSNNNLCQILSISSFTALQPNWDSYAAKAPNAAAITKAVNFIVKQVNAQGREVFFTAPTADGDIVVELKNNKCSIELIFSGEVHDRIMCSCNGEHHAEGDLNETTYMSYIKWLYQ